jgi:hypothetical protein
MSNRNLSFYFNSLFISGWALAKNKGQNQVQFSSKINASEVNVLIVDALTVNAS